MDDNSVKETVCPVRGFGQTEYNSQSQSQNDGKIEFFGAKDPATNAHSNLSMMASKKYDESEDTQTQDEKASQELHNGHNIQNDEKVVQRTLSIGELEPAVDGEPDTMPVDDKVQEAGNGETLVKEKPSDNEKMELDFSPVKKNVPENLEKEKSLTDEGNQVEGGKNSTKMDVSETDGNSMDLKQSEGSNNDTEGFDLHLSQTQSFMFPDEKSNESKSADEPLAKKANASNDKSNESPLKKGDSFDEQSNESGSKNIDGFDDRSNESELKKVDSFDDQSNESGSKKLDSFDDRSNESEMKKTDSCDDQSNDSRLKNVDDLEDQSNESELKKVESFDDQSNESEIKKVESSDEQSNDSEIKKLTSSDVCETKKVEKCEEKASEELIGQKSDNSPGKCKVVADKDDDKSVESMEVDGSSVENVNASGDKSSKTVRLTPKKQVAFEDKVQTMESDNSIDDKAEGCSCMPACHNRMRYIAMHLSSACTQLEDFIKSKRRDDKKLLNNFLDMLKEIRSISDNEEVPEETKISEHVFSLDDAPKTGRKAATKRKSNDMETPIKATPSKKVAEEKGGKPSEKKTIDFKDLKGLAVFAKWPNSGWYYPGIVEDLTAADWKEVSNVTVKFYDGLVRDMKNINILPAYLIPAGSVLCDLEDETEMMVLSCEGSNQNSVDFKLSTKENPDNTLELNFNKLAIKANHMKNIKVQLEPTTDATPKNMHVVSLDNLVSGRRSSRGRTKKDKDEDSEEKAEEKPKVERRTVTPKKATTPRRTRN